MRLAHEEIAAHRRGRRRRRWLLPANQLTAGLPEGASFRLTPGQLLGKKPGDRHFEPLGLAARGGLRKRAEAGKQAGEGEHS